MTRAIFFGTPEIAVPALEALVEIATVTTVVCQPDRPAGRGLALKPPAVKTRAVALGLPVEQPTKIKTPEFATWMAAQEADVALVIAYGRILPKAVLEAPRRGCLNLHASLLPKYRGAAPITWAVVNGETVTGVSLMQMDEGMDTGPVFRMRQLPIGPDMTAGELAVELAQCAADVVRLDVAAVLRGELVATPQDHEEATAARMLDKNDGQMDFTKPARRVHDHVRGMTPWPGAFTFLPGGARLKVLRTAVMEGRSIGPPGAIVVAHGGQIEVACSEGRIAILRAQVEGKKALDARDLVAGRTMIEGAVLGPQAGA